MLAAACTRQPLTQVSRWVKSHDEDGVLDLLEQVGDPDAVDAWRGHIRQEPRTRDNAYSSARTVLEPWTHPTMRRTIDTQAADARVLNIHDLVHGTEGRPGVGTLYVLGTASRQDLMSPVFEALMAAIVREVERAYARSGRPLAKPLLMMLDEAANIARVRDLDTWASSLAGMGMILVTVWQDEAQLEQAYGRERARSIKSNHTAKIYLAGTDDQETLESISRAVGRDLFEQHSTTVTRDGTSHSTSRQELDVATVSSLRTLDAGQAIVTMGRFKPMRLYIPGWWEQPHLRAMMDQQVAADFDSMFTTAGGRRPKPNRRTQPWTKSRADEAATSS